MSTPAAPPPDWLTQPDDAYPPGPDQTPEELREALVDLMARAGRLTVELPQEPWPEAARPGSGFVYVLKFDDGMVKVGHTRSPARRLSEFRRESRRYGRLILDGWLSRPTIAFLGAEAALKGSMRRAGGKARSGAEYFDGVPFELAVRMAGLDIVSAEET